MLLQVNNLDSYYERVQALHEVSLEINEGELVALIGPNGAGKTTLLRSISRLVRSTGEIWFGGQDLTKLSAHDVSAIGIGHSPEGRLLFPDMPVEDNLKLGAFRRRDHAQISKDLKRVYDLFPVLQERKSQMARTMSGGEQQMLAIGRALMTRPRLLILDEPSFGIAPIIVDRIFSAIKELNRDGLTTFFSEQNVRVALENSERTYVLEYGRIVMADVSDTLRDDPRIAKSYLGM